jgi:hypothetical protein
MYLRREGDILRKKKQNPLRLNSFSYKPTYYLMHPWKWFRDLYWHIRNFIHRGRYGFAYTDVWNWYIWWPTVGAEALRYMAEHASAYPGQIPWSTPGKWKNYLLTMASKLEWAASDKSDFLSDAHDKRNEYFGEYKKIKTDNPGEISDEQRQIIDQYWAREHDLELEDEIKRIEIFSEIGKNLPRFWD